MNQQIRAEDVGRATEYRVVDVAEMPGRLSNAAPEGYEWARLPAGAFGLGGIVLLCCRCAAFVASGEAHDEWHRAASC